MWLGPALTLTLGALACALIARANARAARLAARPGAVARAHVSWIDLAVAAALLAAAQAAANHLQAHAGDGAAALLVGVGALMAWKTRLPDEVARARARSRTRRRWPSH